MRREGRPIIGGGAGTGLSAKSEEAGGIDLIVIYNSGRYRMAGRGSAAGLLAFGNANEIVVEMAREVLPVVRHTPVLAGVNGTDPFLLLPQFLGQLKDLGFSGVQNFPTIGLFDGTMRQSFEETGLGFGLEVDMIAAAHALDLSDHALCLQPGRSRRHDPRRGRSDRRAYGRDHRRRRSARAAAKSLDQCVIEIEAIAEAARASRPDVLVLCHGGPISMPEDAAYVLDRAPNCHGFYGASSIERLPVELAIKAQVQAFKSLTTGKMRTS